MAEIKIQHPKRHKKFLYRVEVLRWPPEKEANPRWVPPAWVKDPWGDRFYWPRPRAYLSQASAMKAARTLEAYGCEVAVRRSAQIDWAGGRDVYRSGSD